MPCRVRRNPSSVHRIVFAEQEIIVPGYRVLILPSVGKVCRPGSYIAFTVRRVGHIEILRAARRGGESRTPQPIGMAIVENSGRPIDCRTAARQRHKPFHQGLPIHQRELAASRRVHHFGIAPRADFNHPSQRIVDRGGGVDLHRPGFGVPSVGVRAVGGQVAVGIIRRRDPWKGLNAIIGRAIGQQVPGAERTAARLRNVAEWIE